MKFSDHALLRFTQRVLRVSDPKEARKFIKENKYEVYYKLLNFINESQLLHDKFSIEGEGSLYNYYINKDVLIVISYPKNIVVTLYDIEVDLDKGNNLKKIKQWINQIKRNRARVKKIENKRKQNDLNSRKLEHLVGYMEKELERLKHETENSIEKSKGLALQTKTIKHKNRDLMNEILFGFKKFK